ncbi:MAG: hypothetical protein AMJ43_10430 [Coxiella sp. DG_40]|nr:MAG: hypothetical protein AMJ43_10430 [Coxiella sp. DG_40]
MSEQQFRITFQPSGRSVFVLPGTKITEAAGRAGININTPCGGQGTCGKCRIQITSEAKETPCQPEKDVFSPEELQQGWRLACQTSTASDMTVYIPDDSLIFASQKILTESRGFGQIQTQPTVRKIYVELSEPTRSDNKPDLERLGEQIGEYKIGLGKLKELPKFLRDNDFKGTAVLLDHNLIDLEPGDTATQCYGAAFDIGTSTIVGSLLDLCNGSEMAVTSGINPQVSYGDYVLSRIKHASSCAGCLQQLHSEIISSISKMIESMCQKSNINREQIYEVVIAGNTTMEHLFCGIDPSSLGQVPFVPVHSKGLMFSASELDLSVNHRGLVYLLPIIGGFVGGDITAGILVTNLASQTNLYLLVDVGTNGEIVLAKNGSIWAASTAAGPALEGARISCGMRATHGAIEKVVFDEDVRYSTISGANPIGMCGSGLIDLTAELLKNGVLSTNGRLLSGDELPVQLPDAVKRRVRKNKDEQAEFLVYEPQKGRKDLSVAITQQDIRELQLAVGAIRAGIEIMLRKTDIKVEDIENIFIAGGFGSFIRRTNAQRIGLIPNSVPHNKISFIGNSSLDGAQLALLSTDARRKAEQIAEKTSHIQLSLDSEFQTEFVNAMVFP